MNSLDVIFNPIKISALSVLLFTSSCGSSYKEKEYEEKLAAIADSVKAYAPGIAADTINGISHNFIKTAELKLKVKNVLSSSEKIEDIVKASGGYVTENELRSQIESQTRIKASKDSSLNITRYYMLGDMVLKVPENKLDSVIRKLNNMAVFIDYSRFKAEDVKLKLYANKLSENRNTNFKNNVTAHVKNSDSGLKSTTLAEEKILEARQRIDQSQIETLEMANLVNYSTITLHLYQLPVSQSELIADEPKIKAYEPSFFSKAGAAFIKGYDILLTLLLFLIENWGTIVFFILLFIAVKKGYRAISNKN